MTLADHLVRRLQIALNVCRKQQQLCLESDTPDAVHDMRVSCRRVLEPLRVFEQVLHPQPIEPLRTALRHWMRLSGQVRDLDIAAELAGRSQQQGMEGLHAALGRKRGQRAEAAALQLRNPTPWPKKKEIRQWLRESKRNAHETLWDLELSSEENAALVLPLLLQRYAIRGDSLVQPGAPREAFHRYRLHTKRVRYAAEWFEDLFVDTGGPALVATLKEFQQSLGALQDTAATSVLIEKRSVRKRLDSATLGSLHDYLDREAESAMQRFLDSWRSFRLGASLTRWQDTFPLHPSQTDGASPH